MSTSSSTESWLDSDRTPSTTPSYLARTHGNLAQPSTDEFTLQGALKNDQHFKHPVQAQTCTNVQRRPCSVTGDLWRRPSW